MQGCKTKEESRKSQNSNLLKYTQKAGVLQKIVSFLEIFDAFGEDGSFFGKIDFKADLARDDEDNDPMSEHSEGNILHKMLDKSESTADTLLDIAEHFYPLSHTGNIQRKNKAE